jgi:hypothetical protein
MGFNNLFFTKYSEKYVIIFILWMRKVRLIKLLLIQHHIANKKMELGFEQGLLITKTSFHNTTQNHRIALYF